MGTLTYPPSDNVSQQMRRLLLGACVSSTRRLLLGVLAGLASAAGGPLVVGVARGSDSVMHTSIGLDGHSTEAALSAPPGRTMQRCSYVTLLAGDDYVRPVLCLAEQLRRVRSRCQFAVILLTEELSVRHRRELLRAVGSPKYLISHASLELGGANEWADVTRAANGSRQGSSLLGHRSHQGSGLLGRRLYSDVLTTFYKLASWALPPSMFDLVVFIDVDTIILQNLDQIFETRLVPSRPLAAVAQLPCSQKYFNSGLMMLRPNRTIYEALQQHAQRRASLQRTCEGRQSDQTVLNRFFEGRWWPLPHKFNVNRYFVRKKGVAINTLMRTAAMIHLFAEPKPWNRSATDELSKWYRDHCSRLLGTAHRM